MSREPYSLSAAQRDRAIGALLGTAAGDAFGTDRTLYPSAVWTHNTAMAIAVAEIATFANDPRALTHAGPDAGEVCTLWALAFQHAGAVGIEDR